MCFSSPKTPCSDEFMQWSQWYHWGDMLVTAFMLTEQLRSYNSHK